MHAADRGKGKGAGVGFKVQFMSVFSLSGGPVLIHVYDGSYITIHGFGVRMTLLYLYTGYFHTTHPIIIFALSLQALRSIHTIYICECIYSHPRYRQTLTDRPIHTGACSCTCIFAGKYFAAPVGLISIHTCDISVCI